MDRPIIRRQGLLGCLSLAAFACAAASVTPADAQQVLAGKGAVTIDLGVLNQLGQPVTGGYAPQGGSYPAYGQPAYGQPAYGQPYGQPYAQGYQTYGGLQFPPQQYPVSTLMVQPPAGSTPYVPAAIASAPASTMPAMTASAPAATTSAATSMASSGSSTATGTPPAAASPTPTAVPMLPATTDTGSAASTTATTTATTDTTAPAATVTTGTETTSATPAATTGTETTTASTTASSGSTSAVPAATPLATETTGTTGTETTTAAAPAATGTAASGTAAAGTAASGTQTASVPPGTATAPAAATEGEIRIAFPADSADIPDATKAQLDALAQKMAGDDNMRIQLLAYASGTSDQASRARRMSLSRALAVRSYLIKAGVRSTRMDVRALGNNVEGSPADRVDIIPKAQ